MNIEKATADTERATVAIGNYVTHLDETKRGLAKLLARENISVRHENVSTALFDIQNRVLVLPKFDNISVDQYDLLIGHEVGHAKFSSGPDAIEILQKAAESVVAANAFDVTLPADFEDGLSRITQVEFPIK